MRELYPWARGPFELLNHAEGHYKNGNDIDRRIALVGYDNAIEVAINTYLQLNPKIRSGAEYQREKVVKWLRNYHSKIEFYEFLLQEREIIASVSPTEIIWYHTIRNEMYHSGNGFVPEIQCIKGIRAAAIEVMDILFNVNSKIYLDSLQQISADQEPRNTVSKMNLFLKSYTTLERTIYGTVLALGVHINNVKHMDNSFALWLTLSEQMGEGVTNYENVVKQAIKLRNEFVTKEITSSSAQDIDTLTYQIDELSKLLQSYGFSLNILPTLIERYGDWVNPSISSVRIVQKEGVSMLEVTYKTQGLCDEELKRVNLDFISSGDFEEDEDELLFSPSYSAQYNADRFFDELDLYSICMTGIGDVLFSEQGLKEAVQYCGADTGESTGQINNRF